MLDRNTIQLSRETYRLFIPFHSLKYAPAFRSTRRKIARGHVGEVFGLPILLPYILL